MKETTLRKLGLFALAAPFALATVVFAQDRTEEEDVPVPQEVFAERLPEVFLGGITQDQFHRQQQELSTRLINEMPDRVLDTPVRIQITEDELTELVNAPLTGETPLKVGFVKPVEPAVRVANLDRAGRLLKESRIVAGGMLTPTEDGGYTWAAAFTSDGAGGIRVHVEQMALPDGAELYFYSTEGEAYGPYTGNGPAGTGEFWTPSVMGSTGILQVSIPGPADAADLRGLSLKVTEVGHIGPSFFGGIRGQGTTASFCTYNAPCVENTNCVNDATVNNAELAAAKMLWVSGCCIYTCTGGLIADNDPNQGNYFLTANHCLSSNNAASSLEAFFRYQVSCGTTNCAGTFTDPPSNLIAGKTVGATVKASGSAGDYTLLQLSQSPPSGSVFLGWSTADVANSNGTLLYRISHPSGAPQAYSRHRVDTSAPTCQGWPRGQRIYSRDEQGATEGGSSGSPVINGAGQIVGQLTGSCGFNVGDECDSVSNATVDGAFAYYYPNVAPYLNPGSGCGAAGTSCTSNSQCCSNKCRGGKCR